MSNSQVVTRSRGRRILSAALLCLAVYLLVAYVLTPTLWKRYARHHPNFEDTPGITHTKSGIPGDPINVALIGSKEDVLRIMKDANWHLAAALGIKADLKIAADSVLSRPDLDAPVSSLYMFGRPEDLAFEQEVGNNPRHRHHVRFWKTDKPSDDGSPMWVGSAVYDERVGLSHTTGQVTHVTAPDVDKERDFLFQCLEKTGDLADQYVVDGYHKQLSGKNGGGDPWRTDGRLFVGIIKPSVANSSKEASP